MPWSVTLSSTIVPVRPSTSSIATATRRAARASSAPRCRPGCRSAVTSWSASPQHREAALAADDERRCRWPRRVEPAAVDGLGDHVVDARPASAPASGSSPCSRESSMISWTRRVSRSASCCIRPANRRTASGSSARVDHRLGEQRERADRGLELVADVGDEVAAYGLDPAGLGAVLDQHQHQARRRAARPGPARRCVAAPSGPRAQLELDLADLAVAADLRGPARAARRTSQPLARGPGRGRRPAGLAWTTRSSASSDHGERAQHGQHVGDAGRQQRRGRPRRRAACCSRSLTRNASTAAAPTSTPTTAAETGAAVASTRSIVGAAQDAFAAPTARRRGGVRRLFTLGTVVHAVLHGRVAGQPARRPTDDEG